MTASVIRLDQLLVERGLVETRSRARAAILAGAVRVDGTVIAKPAARVARDAALALDPGLDTHVSRAALKLIHALDRFGIDPGGLVALDLGASTGGFTEVLLERGAARVHAVDVGHGQLHPRLAGDPRVIVHEGVNARALDGTVVPEAPALVVCDVSFIGLKLALPPALALAAPGAWLVALVKPQFEVGREGLGKGGIVRDEALREEVCADIRRWLEETAGWTVAGLVRSPITGGDGNVEYLVAARKPMG
ncbi:TlyA family RNA methyltransferase [Kaustia mangrovi]|uniref:TlyA family RNA methyltransferase n=1 Tax=Kaustia mangrovi TaxID=2593653 RepID=A0A7S8HB32_9HYPH|nr:TlyA family RNA methyltransferase [Kaustia mangrovi]QPC42074.1 TlyA family RNA methyltransferase [Kaustia mangrovi]